MLFIKTISRISPSFVGYSKHVRVRPYYNFNGNRRMEQHMVKTLKDQPKFGLIISYRTNGSGKSQANSYGPFQSIRKLWHKIFGKYLLVTNVVGSGLLMVVGDVMAQEIEYRRSPIRAERYDLARMGRMFIVGALQGPLHHYAYNWMDKIMPVANVRNTIRKILIDQTIMSPACIFIFFYAACYLEKKSVKETNDELREKFLFIYCMDWLLWPGAQYINFTYLDTKYRVTFVNVCTAAYNVFMSYMKHDFDEKPESDIKLQ